MQQLEQSLGTVVSLGFPNRWTSMISQSCSSRTEFCSAAEHAPSPAVVRNLGYIFYHLHNGQAEKRRIVSPYVASI